MRHQYPLPLHHSWPLFERPRHFDLGWVDRASVRPPARAADGVSLAFAAAPDAASDAEAALAQRGIGAWHCDLADDRLTWSDTVYDLFGIARGANVSRGATVAVYREASRAAMERLRAHAIAHRRGFTLDVEIGPAGAASRWIRLIAAPVCDGDTVVALHGYKCLLPQPGR